MSRTTKRLEQRIRAEGLLAPDDVLIAAEVGDVVMWRSNGRLRPHGRPVMAIGYGKRGLAIVGQEWVTGVDLLMVRRVDVLDEATSRPTIRIAFIDDRTGSMTEFMWQPQMRARARQFADSILGSARRRQRQFAGDTANMVTAWERELARREQEAGRLRKQPGDRQLTHVASMRINVETLAFERAHVPEQSAFSTPGVLLLLDDGSIAAVAGEDLIARFDVADVDFLSFPGPLGISDGPIGPWEIGYTTATGNRRLLFSGPGMALFEAQLEQSADSFLEKSGLMELRLDSKDSAWRPKPADESQLSLHRERAVTGPAERERRGPKSGRTPPKRR